MPNSNEKNSPESTESNFLEALTEIERQVSSLGIKEDEVSVRAREMALRIIETLKGADQATKQNLVAQLSTQITFVDARVNRASYDAKLKILELIRAL